MLDCSWLSGYFFVYIKGVYFVFIKGVYLYHLLVFNYFISMKIQYLAKSLLQDYKISYNENTTFNQEPLQDY